jgi:hypothetical protein
MTADITAAVLGSAPAATAERVRATVALLQRRGYALPPGRLGHLILGGAVTETDVRRIVAFDSELTLIRGLVLHKSQQDRAAAIAARASGHRSAVEPYLPMTLRFVERLVAVAPFIRSVAIAGSLASGGFAPSDDVDLNLIVDDGHRHLAYVALNTIGLLHAVRHRDKPVDELTRRPIAPRLMTANLILELSECHPLVRQDEDMAFELMASEPVYGAGVFRGMVDANPGLLEHFPQLARKRAPLARTTSAQPKARWIRVGALEGLAKRVGGAAWRYMQWTRRNRPEALARVAFVRGTMRPYALFDDNAL